MQLDGKDSGKLFTDALVRAAGSGERGAELQCGRLNSRSRTAEIEAHFLGRISYHYGRQKQEQRIAERLSSAVPDTIFYCEHDPVLSLGIRLKNLKDEQICRRICSGRSLGQWQAEGYEVVRSSRGGEATLHLPGQLLIYPVISLKERQIGVAGFVSAVGSAIASYLNESWFSSLELTANFDQSCPGVWVSKGDQRLKIGSAGLRISHGITNHGLSLNLNCSLSGFRSFSPCGFSGSKMTSLYELTGAVPDLESISDELHRKISVKINELAALGSPEARRAIGVSCVR